MKKKGFWTIEIKLSYIFIINTYFYVFWFSITLSNIQNIVLESVELLVRQKLYGT